MTVAQRMTAGEYMALPEQRWTQLVEGELVVSQARKVPQERLGFAPR